MKKITNLLIVCSLALAGAVTAQQPAAEETPGKHPDKKAPAEVKPQAPKTEHAPKPEAPPVKDAAAAAQPPAAHEPAAPPKTEKPEKKAPASEKHAPAAAAPESKTEKPAANTPPADRKHESAESKKTEKAPAPDANKSMTPAANQAASTPAPAKPMATPATAARTETTPATAAVATPAAASTAPANAQTSPARPANPAAAAKKPDVQKVEQIRQQHASFRAEPKPDRVPPVTFTASYRIQGSDRWQGPQYEVYRSYRPERHDQGWYHSHYPRVELIAGGYYYFNNNYWYPAWGYNSAHEYYAYDAPIYAGKHAEPPDKVIADVQAVLQEMGYYKGEVDGLLGPLTREALTGYQADQGLVATAVIDEPTLDSLGMS